MLASLPKLADRTFLVGFCLPVLVAQLAAAWLFDSVQHISSALTGGVEAKTAAAIVIVLVAWVCATLLLVLNFWVYRLMEGYIGPFNRASWRKAQQAEWCRLDKNLDVLRGEFASTDKEIKATAIKEYSIAAPDMATRFPNRMELVMPTRFGNAVRAFENYPMVVYGVDSIPVWFRLQGVMPPAAREMVADARSRVDFFVNLWLLSLLLGVAAAIRASYEVILALYWLSSMDVRPWVVLCGSALLAGLSYEGAVATVGTWGDSVKSAFDLYLIPLARQLGYRVPADPAAAKEFWRKVNEMCLFWRPRWELTSSNDATLHALAEPREQSEDA